MRLGDLRAGRGEFLDGDEIVVSVGDYVLSGGLAEPRHGGEGRNEPLPVYGELRRVGAAQVHRREVEAAREELVDDLERRELVLLELRGAKITRCLIIYLQCQRVRSVTNLPSASCPKNSCPRCMTEPSPNR